MLTPKLYRRYVDDSNEGEFLKDQLLNYQPCEQDYNTLDIIVISVLSLAVGFGVGSVVSHR